MLIRRTPLKRSWIKRKPQVTRIVQRGDREICEGEAWEQRRKECYDRELGHCQGQINDAYGRFLRVCLKSAPLHDEKDAMGFVWRKAGHAHHKNRTRGLGGGKRDDSLSNLHWLCRSCHDEAHKPKKVVPKKVLL